MITLLSRSRILSVLLLSALGCLMLPGFFRVGFAAERRSERDDPRASLLPLIPGAEWVYERKVQGKPRHFRWYTKDGESGEGFSAQGLYPGHDIETGTWRERYRVTEDTRQVFFGDLQGQFFRIECTNAETGESLCPVEKIYWGRLQGKAFLDGALVCELRTVSSFARDLLSDLDLAGALHCRFLARDFVFDWPRPGQSSFSGLRVKYADAWSVEMKLIPPISREILVRGQKYQVFRATTTFASGNKIGPIRSEDDFCIGVGLAKSVQYVNNKEVMQLELLSYDLDKGVRTSSAGKK